VPRVPDLVDDLVIDRRPGKGNALRTGLSLRVADHDVNELAASTGMTT